MYCNDVSDTTALQSYQSLIIGNNKINYKTCLQVKTLEAANLSLNKTLPPSDLPDEAKLNVILDTYEKSNKSQYIPYSTKFYKWVYP